MVSRQGFERRFPLLDLETYEGHKYFRR